MTSFTSSVLQQIPVGAISLTPNDFEKILEKTSRAVVEQLAKKFGFDLNEAYASLGTGVPTKGPKIKSMKVPDDWPYHGICARRTTGLDNKTNPEVVTYRWSALEFQPQLANLRIQIDTEKSTTTHWKLAAGSKAAFSANVHPSAAIVIDYNEDTEGWIPKLYEGSPTLESLDSHKDRCGISTLVSYINNPIVQPLSPAYAAYTKGYRDGKAHVQFDPIADVSSVGQAFAAYTKGYRDGTTRVRFDPISDVSSVGPTAP